MTIRDYSTTDQLLIAVDQCARTLFGQPQVMSRSSPAKQLPEGTLSTQERDAVGRLLRINHTGEVCTQAIYHGQALTAKLAEGSNDPTTTTIRTRLEQAAQEERDHIEWCRSRLNEFDGSTSLFNPLWYSGAFAIGALAGLAGDKWSLGLVAATERQVEAQLSNHLTQLPEQDHKSRAILEQMRQDEVNHANQALAAGGAELPQPLQQAIEMTTKVVANISYWL